MKPEGTNKERVEQQNVRKHLLKVEMILLHTVAPSI